MFAGGGISGASKAKFSTQRAHSDNRYFSDHFEGL